MKNQFSLQYRATIGADFLTKLIQRKKESIQLQLWDTAGTERYNSMGASFYRNSDLCVLVFDSFKDVETWRNDFLKILEPPDGDKFPFVLLGNKCDQDGNINVTKEQIDAYCKEHNDMPYFSTSAKDAINLDKAFDKVADLAFQRYIKNEQDFTLPETQNLKIDKREEPKKKKCC